MKIAAGNELNHRKPTLAPTRQAPSSARPSRSATDRPSWPPVTNAIAVYVSSTIAQQPRGQAVEAVGQVDAVGGARQHEEHEHDVEGADVDLASKIRKWSVSSSPTSSVATYQSAIAIRSWSDELGARRAGRASGLLTIFSQSSAKPIAGAGERRTEHRQAGGVALGEDQVRDRDRGEDHEAAHRRRAGLVRWCCLRALLADVLAELASAQELDELRPEEDRDQKRGEARDQDLAEDDAPRASAPAWRGCRRDSSLLVSACATRSRPTEREPLTSTTSPGSISSRTMRRPPSASRAACTSPASP